MAFACAVSLRRILPSSLMHKCRITLFQDFLMKPPPLCYGYRSLYKASAMGLDKFITEKKIITSNFKSDHRREFLEYMKMTLESKTRNIILREDLLRAIFVVEANEEEISLVVGICKKFHRQSDGLRFSVYSFGAVVMRMLHHLNQPKVALEVIRDEELLGFFDQNVSYILAMDLLYENGMYEDALKVFDFVQDRRIYGKLYLNGPVLIAAASCYKLNTNESYGKAMDIMKGAKEYGGTVSIRACLFVAMLALNQNYIHSCLDILDKLQAPNHISVKNMKILALIELGQLKNCLEILRSTLPYGFPNSRFYNNESVFLSFTIQKLEAAINKSDNKELICEYQLISESFEGQRFVTEKTMDEMICKDVFMYKRHHSSSKRDMLEASFNHRDRGNIRVPKMYYKKYPGLFDQE